MKVGAAIGVDGEALELGNGVFELLHLPGVVIGNEQPTIGLDQKPMIAGRIELRARMDEWRVIVRGAPHASPALRDALRALANAEAAARWLARLESPMTRARLRT